MHHAWHLQVHHSDLPRLRVRRAWIRLSDFSTEFFGLKDHNVGVRKERAQWPPYIAIIRLSERARPKAVSVVVTVSIVLWLWCERGKVGSFRPLPSLLGELGMAALFLIPATFQLGFHREKVLFFTESGRVACQSPRPAVRIRASGSSRPPDRFWEPRSFVCPDFQIFFGDLSGSRTKNNKLGVLFALVF